MTKTIGEKQMHEDDESIKEPELKDEDWSEPDDESLLIEEDIDSLLEKDEVDPDPELPDFSDDTAFPSFRGKNALKMMDATQLYLSEIGFSPLLSAEEEVHYATLALKGDVTARKK